MKNKKIIVAILLSVFLFLAVVLLANKNSKEQNNDFLNNIKSFLSCAKEGETTGASGMPNSCCSGLKQVGGWPGGYSGDCASFPPPTGLNKCAKCGDNICDTPNGENKCNCPEDCK